MAEQDIEVPTVSGAVQPRKASQPQRVPIDLIRETVAALAEGEKAQAHEQGLTDRAAIEADRQVALARIEATKAYQEARVKNRQELARYGVAGGILVGLGCLVAYAILKDPAVLDIMKNGMTFMALAGGGYFAGRHHEKRISEQGTENDREPRGK